MVKKIPPAAEKLMDAFWPGPLTLIFEKAILFQKEQQEAWILWLSDFQIILLQAD